MHMSATIFTRSTKIIALAAITMPADAQQLSSACTATGLPLVWLLEVLQDPQRGGLGATEGVELQVLVLAGFCNKRLVMRLQQWG